MQRKTTFQNVIKICWFFLFNNIGICDCFYGERYEVCGNADPKHMAVTNTRAPDIIHNTREKQSRQVTFDSVELCWWQTAFYMNFHRWASFRSLLVQTTRSGWSQPSRSAVPRRPVFYVFVFLKDRLMTQSTTLFVIKSHLWCLSES